MITHKHFKIFLINVIHVHEDPLLVQCSDVGTKEVLSNTQDQFSQGRYTDATSFSNSLVYKNY